MNEIYLTPTGNERTIEVRSPNIVTIESRKGIDIRLLRKRSNSKTFGGFLLGKMKEASREGNLEMVKSLEFIYNEYKKYEQERNIPLIKIEIIDGWKGNDFQEIVGGIFAIIVFLIIGSAIAGSLATSIDFNGIISGVFILGMVVIGLALAVKVFKILKDMFN